jgi:hypothetical protein
MRFHDFHLEGYEVSEFGAVVTLHLVFDYPGKPKEKSNIRFTGVTLYNFVHTSGAIIIDIEDWPVADFIRETGDKLTEWNHWYGLRGWKDSLSNYGAMLQSEGYKVWSITSAIGFYGFVVAKEVEDA